MILTNASPYKDYTPFMSTFIIFFISYTVGCLFMNVYGMAIDAIFLCFCYDEDKGKGNAKHCPDLLKEFLDEHHKKEWILKNNFVLYK